jgi:hypothetical protein
MSPSSASLRKHRRQSPNFRMYARGRPHKWQRLRSRTLNFGVFNSLAIFAVVAMMILFSILAGPPHPLLRGGPTPGALGSRLPLARVSALSSAAYEARNGIPINCNSFRASSSVFAVVTTDTFMPRALSTFM